MKKVENIMCQFLNLVKISSLDNIPELPDSKSKKIQTFCIFITTKFTL